MKMKLKPFMSSVAVAAFLASANLGAMQAGPAVDQGEQIAALQRQINELARSHQQQLNNLSQQINELATSHQQQLNKLSRLINEGLAGKKERSDDEHYNP